MTLLLKHRLQAVLTTWPFILCLSLLLANDWWFKYSFPGFITGKLSDFSGIAVVALLLFASMPQKKILVYAVITGSFIWWKSPLATPFIDFINGLSFIRFGRVIDYSDCWALVLLPVCNYISTNLDHFHIPFHRCKKVVEVPILLITLFAIMGTSSLPLHQEYVVRPSSPDIKIQRKQMFDTISNVSTKHGLSCNDCSYESHKGTFIGEGVELSYSFSNVNAVSFTVSTEPNGLFFGASSKSKAEDLRLSLKEMLGENLKGLEYVETLKGRYD